MRKKIAINFIFSIITLNSIIFFGNLQGYTSPVELLTADKPAVILPIAPPVYTNEQGIFFLKAAIKKWPMITRYLNKIQEIEYPSDDNTIFSVENYGFFSAKTLHSIKVACDILYEYEDKLHEMKIIEILGGYPYLSKILFEITGYRSYTIVGSHQTILNAKNDLNKFCLPNQEFIEVSDINIDQNYDLVISDHGLLSLDLNQCNACLDHIIDKTPHGYLLMNFFPKNNSCKEEDLLARLLKNERKGCIECENFRRANLEPYNPISDIHNKIVKWIPATEIYSTLYKKTVDAPLRTDFPDGSAVTVTFGGGRLGDDLVAFMHSLWIAKKYNLPMLYKPFKLSTNFILSQMFTPFDVYKTDHSVIEVYKESQILNATGKCIFDIPYYPEYRCEYHDYYYTDTLNIEINKEELGFREKLLEILTPFDPINTIELPLEKLTVAIHVRRGGAYEDYHYHKYNAPLKVPMDHFYVDSLFRILKIYPDRSIYVHLFTDDEDPDSIINYFSEIFENENISFGINHSDDYPTPLNHLLFDFFSMSKFDCLIRAQSNFSITSEYMGQHELVIYPIGYVLDGKEPIFNQVEMRFKKKIL